MDKVIELKRINNELTVRIENVSTLELVSFLSHAVVGVAKDIKENGGIVAYGKFLSLLETSFEAESIDFLVNNIGRENLIERAMEELWKKE